MTKDASNWFRPLGIALGILFLLLALVVLLLDAKQQATEAGPHSAPALIVEALVASSQPLEASVRASGLLEPIQDITIFAETQGQVSSRPVKEDSPVNRGDIILQLDDTYKRTALAKAEAALAEALSRHALEQSQSQRARQLFDSKVISAEELDRQLNREAVANAALRVAKERLREAKEDLSKTVITSPIDGTVVKLLFELFEFVTEGAPAARVIDSSRLKLVVEIPDRERVAVTTNTRATVLLDAFPGRVFQGLTTRVGEAATPETNKFPVEIQLDNPDRQLLPGMVAEATIPITAERTAILLPKELVMDDFGQHYVFLAVGEPGLLRAERRPLKVQDVSFLSGEVEVIDGLSDGEKVISSKLSRLREGIGIKLRPVEGEN